MFDRDDDESSNNSFYRGKIPVRMVTGYREGPFFGTPEVPSYYDNNGYKTDISSPYRFYDDGEILVETMIIWS